eukprot:6134246-Prymnesium_polylepis.1
MFAAVIASDAGVTYANVPVLSVDERSGLAPADPRNLCVWDWLRKNLFVVRNAVNPFGAFEKVYLVDALGNACEVDVPHGYSSTVAEVEAAASLHFTQRFNAQFSGTPMAKMFPVNLDAKLGWDQSCGQAARKLG